MKKILEIGCGLKPYHAKSDEEVIHLDKSELPDIEVVHDLEDLPYPFKDSEFDEIIATNVLEHLHDPVKCFQELHRILKPDGILKILVPHFSWSLAYAPNHRSFFSLGSFELFEEGEISHEINARFTIHKRTLYFPKIYFFFKYIFGNNPSHKKAFIYDNWISKIFPATEIYVELRKG